MFALVAAVLVSAGCGAGNDLYPLSVGRQWKYVVSNTFTSRVQEVTVQRRVPVALTEGYELSGPMGISRLAWRGGTLFAEVLPNTRIYRPMPLLFSGKDKMTSKWSGTIETMGVVNRADGFIEQHPESIDFRSQHVDTEKSTVTLHLPEATIDLETWFVKGVGPIRQEQRTNGKLDFRIELLGGV